MEQFTETEFSESEFNRIDAFYSRMISEGWESIDKIEHKVIRPHKGLVIIAIKYKFSRII